jgi:hypothetical protein
LTTNLTGFGVSARIAVWIFSVSGANWSSMMKVPSSPMETPMFPPLPWSM